jgi:pantoate--beta-alanine ligase
MAVSRSKKAALGLVPTMGALHEGHLSLVRRALGECREVVVSIFVNPTQFGPGEDFKKCPRDLAGDRALLERAGKVSVFAPSVAVMYPAGFASQIRVGGALAEVMEAKFRPGHFEGVATVVARLFGLVRPERAYFGLKDYQQFLVISRMTADLALPVKVLGCPTLREPDGLAMSSRNAYLSPAERAKAPALQRALSAAKAALRRGLSPAAAEREGKALLRREGGFRLQYLSVADAENLEKSGPRSRRRVVAAAAVLGRTRLIDNFLV